MPHGTHYTVHRDWSECLLTTGPGPLPYSGNPILTDSNRISHNIKSIYVLVHDLLLGKSGKRVESTTAEG